MSDPFDENVPDLMSESESTNFVQLRNYAKKLEKELKEKEKALESHETKIADLERSARELLVKDAAKTHGLSDSQLELLFQLKPDADTAALETFAKALGVAAPTAPGTEAGQSAEVPAAPAAEEAGSFQPISGTPVPSTPYTTEDVRAALKRGDTAFLEKVAAEAVRDPSRLQLKHADLIE